MNNFWIVMAFAGWGMGIWFLAHKEGWKKGFDDAARLSHVAVSNDKKLDDFKLDF